MKALIFIFIFAFFSRIYCESAIPGNQFHPEKCSIFFNQNNFKYLESHSTSKIKITISLDTNYYLYGEPVWLTVKIKNTGSFRDSILDLSEYDLSISVQIKNGKGKLLEYQRLLFISYLHTYTVLHGGEERRFYFDLRNWYGYAKPINENKVIKNLLSAGSYSLSLYKYDFMQKSYLRSNYTHFNVTEQDEKESELFSELIEIYSLPEGSVSEKESKSGLFKNVLERMSKDNRYYNEAFYSFVRMNYFTDREELENYMGRILNFITENYNTYESRNIVWYYAESLIKLNGINKTMVALKELRAKYPGTKLDEGIEYAIKSNLFFP